MIVGVYGTLRYGASANRFMRDCKYLGEDTVEGKLYNLGSYPGIRLGQEGDQTSQVKIDLYKLPDDDGFTLAHLDRYEGYVEGDEAQSLYLRKKTVTSEGSQPIEIYEYNAPVSASRLIPSGDWFDVED